MLPCPPCPSALGAGSPANADTSYGFGWTWYGAAPAAGSAGSAPGGSGGSPAWHAARRAPVSDASSIAARPRIIGRVRGSTLDAVTVHVLLPGDVGDGAWRVPVPTRILVLVA